jgi:hypothetical protein
MFAPSLHASALLLAIPVGAMQSFGKQVNVSGVNVRLRHTKDIGDAV